MNHAGRGLYRAFSAGAEPAGEVDALALETLRDVGIRGRSVSSKSWEVFALTVAPRMDVIVTVCEMVARRAMPRWPGSPALRHWSVSDPAGAGVFHTQRKAAYLDCFAELRQHVDALLLAEPPLGALIEQAARGEVLSVDV